jgi:SpoVK/Ycf46/Vps4 family AAA+-type ATPase
MKKQESAGHVAGEKDFRLENIVQRIVPKASWGDLVLPQATLSQLKDICNQAGEISSALSHKTLIKKLSRGTGLKVLFAGPSGTGKTMAAEVLATELKSPLFRIDLSAVVSKYIGETEKNLERIFDAAKSSNAVLFFDEADALFGKRTQIADVHDRYANIETGYLLQKIENFSGIAILNTNVKEKLDKEFLRRMRLIVEFPLPAKARRSKK